MATRTFTPPVGHGHRDMPAALARKTDRRQATKTIAGITLTSTGIGWAAQGWRMERIEASPPYWMAANLDTGQRETATKLTTLVRRLIADGHLVADTEQGSGPNA